MSFITSLAMWPQCAAYIGTGLLYFCRSLATTASDPQLRRQGKRLGRFGFRCWKAQLEPLSRIADPSQISDYVRGYGAAQAMGIHSPRMRIRLASAAKAFSATDYFGFDPLTEVPPANIPEQCGCGEWNPRAKRLCVVPDCRAKLSHMTRYRIWCLALTSAYCAERYGVVLGARYRDLLRWLPYMRPYRFNRRSRAEFYDVAYAVTHVVYTLNDYGRFLLSPDWLPWESQFLQHHLDSAVALGDPDLIGEFLDTLRAFGVDDDDDGLRSGIDFLLDTQNADGSWGQWDHDSLYTGFHATWAAIDGLREFAGNRHGIAFPRLLPQLVNAAARAHGHVSADPKRPDDV